MKQIIKIREYYIGEKKQNILKYVVAVSNVLAQHTEPQIEKDGKIEKRYKDRIVKIISDQKIVEDLYHCYDAQILTKLSKEELKKEIEKIT